MLGSLFVDVSNLRLLMPVLSVLLLRNLDISGSGLCVMGLLGVMGLLSVMGLLLHVVGLIDVSRSVSSLLLHVVRLLNVVGLRVDRLAVVLCLVRRTIWLIWPSWRLPAQIPLFRHSPAYSFENLPNSYDFH